MCSMAAIFLVPDIILGFKISMSSLENEAKENLIVGEQ